MKPLVALLCLALSGCASVLPRDGFGVARLILCTLAVASLGALMWMARNAK